MNSPTKSDTSKQLHAAFPKFVIVQVVISIVAAVMLIAVVLQIGPLIEKRAELEEEIEKKNASVTELTELESSLRKDVEELVDQLKSQQTIASIQAIRPRAKSVPVPGDRTASGRAYYDFTLWLDVPGQLESKIARVQYKFDHPSFSNGTFVSDNEQSGFLVGYRGWGCLAVVKITVFLKDGAVQPIYFKMCAALTSLDDNPHQ